jgi:hypothetical protein
MRNFSQMDAARNDVTPQTDGKQGGQAWTPVNYSAGEGWVQIGPSMFRPNTEAETVRISYEVRGKRAGSAPILAAGQANISSSGGNAVITELIESFTHPRVRLAVDGPLVYVQIRRHATEDWSFRLKCTYDKVIAWW